VFLSQAQIASHCAFDAPGQRAWTGCFLRAWRLRCVDAADQGYPPLWLAIERLRDSPLFAVPYFELIDILPALEDGYLDIEQAKSVS